MTPPHLTAQLPLRNTARTTARFTALTPPRFTALTGLRAIAAMMIFGFHLRKFWVSHLPAFLVRLLNEFQSGVSIFFVLSGFLIAYTYRDRPLDSKKEYIKYILVRFARIFPIYLLLLTAKYAASGFPSVKETFLNYTLLKGFSDEYNLTGIPQSWSLTVEITFYLLAPLIYLLGQRKKWMPLPVGIGLFLLASLLGFWGYKTGHNKAYWLYDYLFVLNATFFGRFFEFYIGMLLAFRLSASTSSPSPASPAPAFGHQPQALSHRQWLRSPAFRHTLIGFCGILLSMFLVNCFASNGYSPGTTHLGGVLMRNLLLPIFTAIFIYGLIRETTWLQKILSSRVFVLLGNSSYIFYLIHINFGYYTLARVKEFPDYNFTLLWLFSIVAYLLLERPLYELVKKRIRSPRPVSIS